MATSLRELEKKQAHLRSTLEGIQQFVAHADAAKSADQVDVRLQRLDETFNEFRNVRIQIELLSEAEGVVVETEDGESKEDRDKKLADAKKKRKERNAKILTDVEEFYCDLKVKLNKMRIKPESTVAVPLQSTSAAQPVGLSHVKLPDINLKVFDGRLSEWVVFRDTFLSLIHNNTQLSDVDKFTYLRSSLVDEAFLEIASIDVSAATYEVAWETLKKRYENKKLIVKAHLDALDAVEPMKQESYEALNHLVGSFDKHLMMLKKVEEKTDSWSTLLVHMVCSRLDNNTLRLWETHHKSKDVPNFKDLMEFLRNQCSVLQSVAPPKANPVPEKQRRPSVSHAATQSVNKCPFCDALYHSPFHCLVFLKQTVSQRLDSARRFHLCLNCLSARHPTRSCTRGSCHHCHQYHHSLLHVNAVQERPSDLQALTRPTFQQQNQQQQQQQHSLSTDQQQPHTPTQNQSSNTAQSNTHSQNTQQLSTTDPCTSQHTTTLSISSHNRNREILLSTVEVCIRDQRGHTRIARALLDSCSQYSFMTTNCCKTLALYSRPDYLSVQGIGGSAVVSRQLVTANVLPRSSDLPQFNRPINFYVLPELTSTLPTQSINIATWKLPDDIVLADPHFNEPGEVDLIIGAEYYFDLLRDGRSRVTDEGPMLQNTVFGWVVSGLIPSQSTSLHVAVTQPHPDRRQVALWRPAVASSRIEQPEVLQHQHQPERTCSSINCTSKHCCRLRQSAENRLSVSSSSVEI